MAVQQIAILQERSKLQDLNANVEICTISKAKTRCMVIGLHLDLIYYNDIAWTKHMLLEEHLSALHHAPSAP